MKSSCSARLATAFIVLGVAHVARAEVTQVGCYSSSTGLKFDSTDTFNSLGYCSRRCPDSAAFALTKRFDCWCGDTLPPKSTKVDDDLCNLTCPGYDQNNCGSSKYFMLYNMGTTTALQNAPEESSTAKPSSPSSTSSSKPSVVTVGGQTVVVTAPGSSSATTTPTPEPSSSGSSGSSGPSTAGIAAGVVIGVVALAAIAGGTFLFLRNRKRRAIEEEHRRNAAVNSFVGSGKPPTSSGGASSFTDSRLDSATMAQRRMSDGSIADNQDYSRRILKVTNA